MTTTRAMFRRPSPAMVVAVIGLVAATSGDAVADGVRAIATAVGQDQVTSRSVKDSSLRLKDFQQSARVKLKGPRGEIGAKGETGANALARISQRSVPAGELASPPVPGCPPAAFCPGPVYATGTAMCPEGHTALSGGADDHNEPVSEVVATYPTADGRGWTATIKTDDITQPPNVRVSVLCAPTRPQ